MAYIVYETTNFTHPDNITFEELIDFFINRLINFDALNEKYNEIVKYKTENYDKIKDTANENDISMPLVAVSEDNRDLLKDAFGWIYTNSYQSNKKLFDYIYREIYNEGAIDSRQLATNLRNLIVTINSDLEEELKGNKELNFDKTYIRNTIALNNNILHMFITAVEPVFELIAYISNFSYNIYAMSDTTDEFQTNTVITISRRDYNYKIHMSLFMLNRYRTDLEKAQNEYMYKKSTNETIEDLAKRVTPGNVIAVTILAGFLSGIGSSIGNNITKIDDWLIDNTYSWIVYSVLTVIAIVAAYSYTKHNSNKEE